MSSSRFPLAEVSFGAFAGELQQLRDRLDVPVSELRLGVPQIGAELKHLALRIEAAPIPVHDRAHREGMAQVVDARTTAMLVEALRLAQADSLAHHGEVVARAAVGWTFVTLKKEERDPTVAEYAMALGAIGSHL